MRFLDWANGRLERAIRAKRKVIALLNEQKQAIIHRAVTRGLDPSVPLKPSGIPWLGDIPQHWEVRRAEAACSSNDRDALAAWPNAPSADHGALDPYREREYVRAAKLKHQASSPPSYDDLHEVTVERGDLCS